MAKEIRTHHEFPPIPIRTFDWCAYRDGDDENGHSHGWGRTKAEAIEDLLRLEDEENEYQEDMAAQAALAGQEMTR